MREFKNNGTPTHEEFQEDLRKLSEQYYVVKSKMSKFESTLYEVIQWTQYYF